MLTRRSRELGTYLLIGLEHRQVARLFFLENLAVGAVALVLGVVLGNLMFQILRAIMLALFGVEYRLSFAFSLEAVGMTLLYVLLVYLLALGRSRRRIRRMQIHDFMELDRQNENVVIRTSRRRRRVFVLSLLLGAVGTVLLLAGGCCLAWWGRGVSSPFSMASFSALPRGCPRFLKNIPEGSTGARPW
ncbi:MAG: FtsX-like permease family protein [Evtepia gabavorous]